jgi:hypothetical protein
VIGGALLPRGHAAVRGDFRYRKSPGGRGTFGTGAVDHRPGQRVGDGLGISTDDVRGLEPLQTQTLSDDELARAANLGKNGPRDVSGLTTTHTVPNERVVLA